MNFLTVSLMKGLLMAQRDKLRAEAIAERYGRIWQFWEPMMLAIGPTGDRLNGSDYWGFNGTIKQVKRMLAEYPDTVEIVVQLRLNCFETFSDMANEYEPDACSGQVTIWNSAISSAMSVTDKDWRENTAFKSLGDCLKAGGDYRPSMDMREPIMRRLADRYDLEQEANFNHKRAYRYGEN